MAEAIAGGLEARREVETSPTGNGRGVAVEIRFASAGTATSGGSPRAAEGTRAVRALGYEPAVGPSRELTRAMIEEADLIYGMTRSHVAAVLAMDPTAKTKTALLDPAGEDVGDPIGMEQGAYDEVASRMESMIERRLKEWRP